LILEQESSLEIYLSSEKKKEGGIQRKIEKAQRQLINIEKIIKRLNNQVTLNRLNHLKKNDTTITEETEETEITKEIRKSLKDLSIMLMKNL